MKNTKNSNRYVRRVDSFKPDSEYVKNAIEEFESRGGRISKSKPIKDAYARIMADKNTHSKLKV